MMIAYGAMAPQVPVRTGVRVATVGALGGDPGPEATLASSVLADFGGVTPAAAR